VHEVLKLEQQTMHAKDHDATINSGVEFPQATQHLIDFATLQHGLRLNDF